MTQFDKRSSHLKLKNEIAKNPCSDGRFLLGFGGKRVSMLHQGNKSDPHPVLSRVFSLEKIPQKCNLDLEFSSFHVELTHI